MSDLVLPNVMDAGLLAAQKLPRVDGAPRNAAEIRAVAEDFEAFFAGLVFDEITADLGPDPLTGGGEAESMFRTLLNQEFGKSVARSGTLGIADIVQRQLLQLQEVQ
ncbi:MAG: rod-binding protein [Rhodospirillaceae bacterium]|nr:rod-binding protein [Rhodospirillaceae bacterium]